MVQLARERRQDVTRKAIIMVAEGNETLTRTALTAKEIAANANFLSTRYTMREADKAAMLQQAIHMENIATAQQNRLQALSAEWWQPTKPPKFEPSNSREGMQQDSSESATNNEPSCREGHKLQDSERLITNEHKEPEERVKHIEIEKAIAKPRSSRAQAARKSAT